MCSPVAGEARENRNREPTQNARARILGANGVPALESPLAAADHWISRFTTHPQPGGSS